MNEREMLELAAKAAGYLSACHEDGTFLVSDCFDADIQEHIYKQWRPDLDDGDCARMEAYLGIEVAWSSVYAMSDNHRLDDCMIEHFVLHNGDKQAARRRASLRVAAQIGKSMP